jgi:aquaporin Z
LISIRSRTHPVNPARSTAVALFVGDWALQQLWLFWLLPIVGAALAGFVHRRVLEAQPEPPIAGR